MQAPVLGGLRTRVLRGPCVPPEKQQPRSSKPSCSRTIAFIGVLLRPLCLGMAVTKGRDRDIDSLIAFRDSNIRKQKKLVVIFSTPHDLILHSLVFLVIVFVDCHCLRRSRRLNKE